VGGVGETEGVGGCMRGVGWVEGWGASGDYL